MRSFQISVALSVIAWTHCGCRGSGTEVKPAVREAVAIAAKSTQPIATPVPTSLSDVKKRQIHQMVHQILAAQQVEARAAAALAASDAASDSLRKTLHALQKAEKVVLENVQCADFTGYRAIRPVMVGDSYVFLYDQEQGSLESTNRPLDLGIQGDGYFVVSVVGDTGPAYTRNGNFFVNNRQQLVLGMGEGYALQPPVAIPNGVTDISITEDGLISVQVPGATVKRTVGQIKLARFRNGDRLKRLGGCLFLASEASGSPILCTPASDGAGRIEQSFLEASNVDLVREQLRLRFLTDWREAIQHAIDSGAH
jgi:flagellar basal body rod protein FlgF